MKTVTQIVTISALPTSASGKPQASNNHAWLPTFTHLPTGTILLPKSILGFPAKHFFEKTAVVTGHQSVIAASSMGTSIYNTGHFKNESSWTFNKSGRIVGATFQALHSNIAIPLQTITTSSFKAMPSILKAYSSVPTVSEVSVFTDTWMSKVLGNVAFYWFL